MSHNRQSLYHLTALEKVHNMELSARVCNFYKDVIATLEMTFTGREVIKKIAPLSRLNFCAGIGIAVSFLVEKVALSIFFSAGTLTTCGLHQGFRTSLFTTSEEALVYGLAIPVGLTGALFPQTVNQTFLGIPPDGLVTRP
jgi:hypothetical protein